MQTWMSQRFLPDQLSKTSSIRRQTVTTSKVHARTSPSIKKRPAERMRSFEPWGRTQAKRRTKILDSQKVKPSIMKRIRWVLKCRLKWKKAKECYLTWIVTIWKKLLQRLMLEWWQLTTSHPEIVKNIQRGQPLVKKIIRPRSNNSKINGIFQINTLGILLVTVQPTTRRDLQMAQICKWIAPATISLSLTNKISFLKWTLTSPTTKLIVSQTI